MFNSKYSKLLTAILIIAIIGIIGVLVFLGIDYYKKITLTTDTDQSIDEFDGYVNNVIASKPSNKVESNTQINIELTNNITNNVVNETTNEIDANILFPNTNTTTNTTTNTQTGGSSSSSSSSSGLKYKGFNVIGKIEIPKIDLEYQVLEESTPKALETSVCKLYGPGINEVGNTVIIGHNYKNGTFFSNNKKLSVGDKIKLTDMEGNKVTYKITKKYTTSTNDFEYAIRDTKGKREISLSTCTDDTKSRLIIWAEEI